MVKGAYPLHALHSPNLQHLTIRYYPKWLCIICWGAHRSLSKLSLIGVAVSTKHRHCLSKQKNDNFVYRSKLYGLILTILLASLPKLIYAQNQGEPGMIINELPNAPSRGGASASSPDQQALCSLSGTVLDINLGVVPGATITVIGKSHAPQPIAISDADGHFSFADVTAGSVQFRVISPGFETFVSNEIILQPGEKYEAGRIVLQIAAITTEVEVTVTQKEVAQEQLKAAEKQRVLGVIPNFYSSYIWNAAPLSPKQKFELAFRSKLDPVAFVSSGVTAAIEQASNRFPRYGQDAQGYAKRFGASYATGAIGRLIGSAVLPSLLHQDPRYFYRGSGSIPARTFYALSASLICKGDNGRLQPNYSHVLGNLAAGGMSNLYHPAGDRGAMLTIDNALIGTAADAVSNVVREFLLRKLTPQVPVYANGKP